MPAVTVRELSTIQKSRASGLVRYAEPMGYEPGSRQAVTNSSGCDNHTPNSDLVAGADYTVLANGSKSSWNQADQFHGIRSSWSQSTGKGVKIVIIDSGSSDARKNLGSAFNQGLSQGRTIERLVTLPRASIFGIPAGPVETRNDGCGHGTSMAGAAVAPRGTDGAAAAPVMLVPI